MKKENENNIILVFEVEGNGEEQSNYCTLYRPYENAASDGIAFGICAKLLAKDGDNNLVRFIDGATMEMMKGLAEGGMAPTFLGIAIYVIQSVTSIALNFLEGDFEKIGDLDKFQKLTMKWGIELLMNNDESKNKLTDIVDFTENKVKKYLEAKKKNLS